MDKICINNLELFARHGVMSEEKSLGQKFVISVEMETDTENAGLEDNLKKTVNYAEVCEMIGEFNKNNTFKLIEAAAENMAHMLLWNIRQVQSVTIRIDKPNAPIHMHFDSVSAQIKRKRTTAYISVGSNMGDRRNYIKQAVKALNENPYCKVKRISELIETEPYGNVEQDKFLNGIIELETTVSAQKLLCILNEIEAKNGRKRDIHWGPRTLDLDIVFFGNEIINTPGLTVPHIDMHNRAFVLEPLCSLAPYIIHPVLGQRVCDIYKNLNRM